ncbi:hypothetical protein PR048_009710 [Dryococelus australis]|uniref:Uncharacterized protein n=1 Tax=Dryococelus australis TaxID=614101 RepID=A0ABQ9I0P0_9NEOP|nr:hypothetical protein PR048_009710 [Dryococelus australis]
MPVIYVCFSSVQKFYPRETKWEIISFLRHCYYLFKNVPARRADYIQITGSEHFPKKFCAIGCLENMEVAECAMKFLHHLKKFVKEVSISSVSFNIVKSSLADKIDFLLLFGIRAGIVEAPMAPFLYDSLEDISLALVEKICEIIERLLDHLWLHILKAHSFSAKSGLLKFVKEIMLISRIPYWTGIKKLQKKEKEEANKRKAERRRVQEEIKELQKKKAQVLGVDLVDTLQSPRDTHLTTIGMSPIPCTQVGGTVEPQH